MSCRVLRKNPRLSQRCFAAILGALTEHEEVEKQSSSLVVVMRLMPSIQSDPDFQKLLESGSGGASSQSGGGTLSGRGSGRPFAGGQNASASQHLKIAAFLLHKAYSLGIKLNSQQAKKAAEQALCMLDAEPKKLQPLTPDGEGISSQPENHSFPVQLQEPRQGTSRSLPLGRFGADVDIKHRDAASFLRERFEAWLTRTSLSLNDDDESESDSDSETQSLSENENEIESESENGDVEGGAEMNGGSGKRVAGEPCMVAAEDAAMASVRRVVEGGNESRKENVTDVPRRSSRVENGKRRSRSSKSSMSANKGETMTDHDTCLSGMKDGDENENEGDNDCEDVDETDKGGRRNRERGKEREGGREDGSYAKKNMVGEGVKADVRKTRGNPMSEERLGKKIFTEISKMRALCPQMITQTNASSDSRSRSDAVADESSLPQHPPLQHPPPQNPPPSRGRTRRKPNNNKQASGDSAVNRASAPPPFAVSGQEPPKAGGGRKVGRRHTVGGEGPGKKVLFAVPTAEKENGGGNETNEQRNVNRSGVAEEEIVHATETGRGTRKAKSLERMWRGR